MSRRALRSKRDRSDDEIEPPKSKRRKPVDDFDIKNLGINGMLEKYGSNDKLNRAIETAFKQKYGDESVRLFMFKHPSTTSVEYTVGIRYQTDEQKKNPKSKSANFIGAVRFLRTFGHLVSKMEVDYAEAGGIAEDSDKEEASLWKSIERLIIEYCAHSLVHLTLEHNKGNAFDGLRTTFKNVENLQLLNSRFTSKTALITKYFPNVKQFTLDCRGFNIYRFNNNSVISEQLIDRVKRISSFPYSDQKMVNLIQKYGRPTYSANEFLDAVNRNMPQLKSLFVYGVEIDGLPSVHFKNVTQFSIDHCGTAHLSEQMPFSFEKLESLKLSGFNPSNRPAIFDFWKNLNGLIKLNFNPSKNYGNIDNDLRVICDKLANLQEITIHEYENSVTKQALEQLLVKCSTLRKLRIQFFYGIEPERDKLTRELSDLSSNWIVTQTAYGTHDYLIIERND